MTEAELQRAIAKVSELVAVVMRPKPEKGIVEKWLSAWAGDEANVRAARQRLLEAGLPAEEVKRFPPLQVVLLDEKHAFAVRLDDEMKLMRLPYWQMEPLLPAHGVGKGDKGKPLFPWMTPYRVRRAQVRLEQRFGLLRHVEALRLYAAEHDGKLPAKLADVKVPLPVDPFTGQPFVYRLDGATATVRGSPPRGEEKNPFYNIRYVVTIRK
jgi:hypothetical protein